MTVPTNNEDREALARHFHEAYERLAPKFNYSTRVASAVPWEDVPENNKRLMIAVAGEILAARRLPVSGDNAEARAEAERRWPRGWDVEEGTFRDGSVNGFILGAEWQASQLREAAPSDSDREALIEAATWALIDYDTDVADRGVRDEHYRERRADVERVLPILSRASHPVQVEVTDDMVERAAEGIARERLGRHVESLDDYWDGRPDAKRLDIDACKPSARAALVAALGDGDHAE